MPKVTINKHIIEPNLIEYYNNRKKITIRRSVGGLGDILMHRMIFEDFKILMPDCYLTFAIPLEYFDAVSDHPYIDCIVDHKTHHDLGITYNTSFACNDYELKTAPFCDKHRVDIWADHCGIKLTKHNMNFRLTEDEKAWASTFVKKMNPQGKKTIIVSPVSAMISKNMNPEQIQPVIDVLAKDYCIFALHTRPLPEYHLPCITGTTIRHFISLLNEADYVISVDSAAFHCAGGLGKPTLAIFGWADSLIYSMHYKKIQIVQKHRNYTPGWTCGPCYKFTSCPKVPNVELRKPCITEITPEMILDGFDKLVNIYTNASN